MKLLTTRSLAVITLLVTILTIFGVWFWGIGSHHTIFENSVISTTILSFTFFLFLTISLYNGVKLKDNIGRITDKITFNKKKFSRLSDIFNFNAGFDVDLVGGEGCGGIILSIIAWIVVSIALIFLVCFLGTILWVMALVFAAMLYWIFFRALRLVFLNRNKCQSNLFKSAAYGLAYTLLYNFWIYGLLFTIHYLTA